MLPVTAGVGSGGPSDSSRGDPGCAAVWDVMPVEAVAEDHNDPSGREDRYFKYLRETVTAD